MERIAVVDVPDVPVIGKSSLQDPKFSIEGSDQMLSAEMLSKKLTKCRAIILEILTALDGSKRNDLSFVTDMDSCISLLSETKGQVHSVLLQSYRGEFGAPSCQRSSKSKGNSYTISVIENPYRRSKSTVTFSGIEFLLPHDSATLLKLIVEANGEIVSIETIMEEFDITRNNAHQKAFTLLHVLPELKLGIEHSIVRVRGKGYYFDHSLLKK